MRAKKKRWTFMVYMAGDNDLDPRGVPDLKEMKRVGSTDAVNIVAEFDRSRGHHAKRYFLRKGGTVQRDIVSDVGRTNTGDPRNLVRFVNWAAGTYPAERYVLVLWNHGYGWDDTDLWEGERRRRFRRLASQPVRHALFHTPARRLLQSAVRGPDHRYRAILMDQNAKDFLDSREMKKVLQATTAVGSTETAPLEGWPYDTILRALIRDPGMTPGDLSALIVRKYLDSYRGDQVTQSACDLSRSAGLAAAVRSLAQALRSGIGQRSLRGQIAAVRDKVQFYDDDVKDNVDLLDFCTLLVAAGVGPSVRRRCEDVIRRLQDEYVVAAGAKGPDLRHSHGVAIYFPRAEVSPLYPGLDFSKRTGWHRFLKAYLRAVRAR